MKNVQLSAEAGLDDRACRHWVEAVSAFAIFGIDFDGMIVSWNRGVEDLLDYGREEFVGLPAGMIFSDPDLRSGTRQTWLVRKDGQRVHAEVATSVARDDDGNPCGFAAVARATAATPHGDRLQAIIDQLPFGLAIAAAGSGELLSLNHEGVRVLGHPLRRVATYDDYVTYGNVHPDGTPYRPEEYPIVRAVHGETVTDEEVLYVAGDGTLTHLAVSATPVLDGAGNILAAVSTFHDISERKQAEAERDQLLKELQRSNEDLSTFAHTVSHDLQAPLRTMRSYSDLLTRRYAAELDGTGADLIRYIAEGAERMDDLVQALLRYARAGGAELVPDEVRTGDILDAALTDLQPTIEEANADVRHHDLPTVRADAVQLTQLFQNLVGNAIKYRREEARPEIFVSAARSGNRWIFTVADNGAGIPIAYQDRVFLPLKRLHGADVPGSGMGLAICRRIVQRHSGHIWVESEPGAGARFRFTLPALPH